MKKKEILFEGFSPKAFQFLKDIKENNYKEWFDAHKDIYENEVLNPMKGLVVGLSPAMHNIDTDFELRPHRAVSRIYRDVRFSKNKDPYKSHLWLTFQIPVSRDDWKDFPGYFIEISDEGCTLGLGLFMPKKKTMDIFREEIGYIPEEFKEMTQKIVLDRGYTVNGEMYKRPIANDLGEYFQTWIQRKGVWVEKRLPINEKLNSKDFMEYVKEDFEALGWLYNFMKEATLL